MQQMRKSEVEKYYASTRFGNESIEIGNICWIRVNDEEGLHEYPVEVIPDPVLEYTESFETIIKTVKAQSNSGRVYLPVGWVGKKVKILLLEY